MCTAACTRVEMNGAANVNGVNRRTCWLSNLSTTLLSLAAKKKRKKKKCLLRHLAASMSGSKIWDKGLTFSFFPSFSSFLLLFIHGLVRAPMKFLAWGEGGSSPHVGSTPCCFFFTSEKGMDQLDVLDLARESWAHESHRALSRRDKHLACIVQVQQTTPKKKPWSDRKKNQHVEFVIATFLMVRFNSSV